jgi:hypothetical protein
MGGFLERFEGLLDPSCIKRENENENDAFSTVLTLCTMVFPSLFSKRILPTFSATNIPQGFFR